MSENGSPTFTPAHPDFAAVVRDSFSKQGFLTGLGATLETVSPGRVVIVLPFSDRVTQQREFFHGGALGAIGDSAGGYAALTLLPAGSEVVTVEYKINFVRPAVGSWVRAVGQVLRSGRSLTVARIDIGTAVGNSEMGASDGFQDVALMQATFLRTDA